MTNEEKHLIQEILKDHPVRNFFDGKTHSGYIPTAREVYIMLGKELPEEKRKDNV